MTSKLTLDHVNIKRFLILIFISVLTFLSIRHDFFNVKESNGFRKEAQSEWLLGSILKAREDGIFSTGTFTSLWQPKGEGLPVARRFTNKAYKQAYNIKDFPDGDWYTYKSALRWTTTVHEAIDVGYYRITGVKADLLPFHRTIASILFILVLLLLANWIIKNANTTTLVLFSILLVFAPWLVRSAGSPGAGIWIKILPFIAGLYLYDPSRKGRFKCKTYWQDWLYGCVGIFLIATKEYEYIPTICFSLLIAPVFYFIQSANKDWFVLIKRLFWIGVGAVSGFALGFLLHAVAVYATCDSWEQTIDFFKTKFLNRTTDIAIQQEIINTDKTKFTRIGIIQKYLSDKVIFGDFTTGQLLITFLVTTPFLWLRGKRFPLMTNDKNVLLGLWSIVCIALIGALSFFIVFKSHAVKHQHVDYIFLSIPFLIPFLLYISYFINHLCCDLLGNWIQPKYVSQALIVLALIPLCLTLMDKYQLSEAIEFKSREKEVFNFSMKQRKRINKKTTQLIGNKLEALTNDPMIYINLKDAPEEEHLIMQLDFSSNDSGLTELFYKSCAINKYSQEQTLRKQIEKGHNQFYFEVPIDQCSNQIRLDLINKKSAIVNINAITIK